MMCDTKAVFTMITGHVLGFVRHSYDMISDITNSGLV